VDDGCSAFLRMAAARQGMYARSNFRLEELSSDGEAAFAPEEESAGLA